MDKPLMPKAVAVWLIDNTALTFDQIAAFCGMHPLEVKGIADGEVAVGIIGSNPITTSELTAEEIQICEQDANKRLKLNKPSYSKLAKVKTRYTPIARRQDKPDAIFWFIKNYPTVKDSILVKLLGTTKNTIDSVRLKTHWNMPNIKPKDPVLLGLCTQKELDNILQKMEKETNLEKKESE
jgi:hypothetical protein